MDFFKKGVVIASLTLLGAYGCQKTNYTVTPEKGFALEVTHWWNGKSDFIYDPPTAKDPDDLCILETKAKRISLTEEYRTLMIGDFKCDQQPDIVVLDLRSPNPLFYLYNEKAKSLLFTGKDSPIPEKEFTEKVDALYRGFFKEHNIEHLITEAKKLL